MAYIKKSDLRTLDRVHDILEEMVNENHLSPTQAETYVAYEKLLESLKLTNTDLGERAKYGMRRYRARLK